MLCSNCGKDIPFSGKVCPYCHADKSKDQATTVAAGLGAFVGGSFLFGIVAVASGDMCTGMIAGIVGVLIGAFVGALVGAAKVKNQQSAEPPQAIPLDDPNQTRGGQRP